MNRKILAWLIVFAASSTVTAVVNLTTYTSNMNALFDTLLYVGAAFAIALIIVQAMHWMSSDSPEARAEAKKNIIYIFMGLLVLYLAAYLTCGVVGYGLSHYEITCSMSAQTPPRCLCTPN